MRYAPILSTISASWIFGTVLVSGCSTSAPTGAIADPSALASGPEAPGYRRYAFSGETRIPDGDAAAIRIGPLTIPDPGASLYDVALEVDLTPQPVAEFELELSYVEPGTRNEIRVPVELYRARAGRFDAPELFAYPVTLEGRYYFHDRPGVATPDPIADPGTPSFSAFDGRRAGGTFYLEARDGAPGTIAFIRSWAVYVRDAPALVTGDVR